MSIQTIPTTKKKAPLSTGVCLNVPLHAQDCPGYCGPGCVTMILDAYNQIGPAGFSQVQSYTAHYKENDGAYDRWYTSPEQLSAMLADRLTTFRKRSYALATSAPPAVTVVLNNMLKDIRACLDAGQPAVALLAFEPASKTPHASGTHWVVVHGYTMRNGSPSGYYIRDPWRQWVDNGAIESVDHMHFETLPPKVDSIPPPEIVISWHASLARLNGEASSGGDADMAAKLFRGAKTDGEGHIVGAFADEPDAKVGSKSKPAYQAAAVALPAPVPHAAAMAGDAGEAVVHPLAAGGAVNPQGGGGVVDGGHGGGVSGGGQGGGVSGGGQGGGVSGGGQGGGVAGGGQGGGVIGGGQGGGVIGGGQGGGVAGGGQGGGVIGGGHGGGVVDPPGVGTVIPPGWGVVVPPGGGIVVPPGGDVVFFPAGGKVIRPPVIPPAPARLGNAVRKPVPKDWKPWLKRALAGDADSIPEEFVQALPKWTDPKDHPVQLAGGGNFTLLVWDGPQGSESHLRAWVRDYPGAPVVEGITAVRGWPEVKAPGQHLNPPVNSLPADPHLSKRDKLLDRIYRNVNGKGMPALPVVVKNLIWKPCALTLTPAMPLYEVELELQEEPAPKTCEPAIPKKKVTIIVTTNGQFYTEVANSSKAGA